MWVKEVVTQVVTQGNPKSYSLPVVQRGQVHALADPATLHL